MGKVIKIKQKDDMHGWLSITNNNDNNNNNKKNKNNNNNNNSVGAIL